MTGPKSSLSVRTRMILFTTLLIALLVLIGSSSAWISTHAASMVQKQAEVIAPARAANVRVLDDLRSAERSFSAAVTASQGAEIGDVSSSADLLAPWNRFSQRYTTDIDAVQRLAWLWPLNDTSRVGNLSEQIAQMRASTAAWVEASRLLTKAAEEETPPQADMVRARALYGVAMQDNAAVQATLDAAAISWRSQVVDMLGDGARIVLTATVLAALLAIFTAWRTVRSLTGPLLGLRETLRRQVEGERTAWANVEAGTPEIRAVAADLNHLNREHLRLVDQQAQSLALLQAGNDAVMLVSRETSMVRAAQVATDAIGTTLAVDAVRLAGWTDEGPYAAVWSRTATARLQVPEMWWYRISAHTPPTIETPYAVRVWDGGARSELDSLDTWIAEDPVVVRSKSALFLPILVDGDVAGVISVSSWADERSWDASEIAYIERVMREMARKGVALARA
ncbi:hypothetical protein [Dermatophilus congolensis]|uniref:hypothetical protein n=1 Tax=Dermatophilus congolensis TaxID=1863 RepID=UPI001AAE3B58|nr:hypothetical protein [Dermatophilus congolensis]MBO3142122.1 hypothetical protein [Dermatophilus congolensis]MBO3151114.1 hypothetical protein [Dermatophilus congolensis]MBO3161884.1 hypothetical protein [Dermatophilus congolensis]MBO3162397.1 hypothetical protein [Dermatophilus congolensis]MBO3175955.1 hypothetical protein [Dermatophilus congolensis]